MYYERTCENEPFLGRDAAAQQSRLLESRCDCRVVGPDVVVIVTDGPTPPKTHTHTTHRSIFSTLISALIFLAKIDNIDSAFSPWGVVSDCECGFVFRVGPLDSDKKYSVEAEKEGYVLTASSGGSFKAFKLGEIVVKVFCFVCCKATGFTVGPG